MLSSNPNLDANTIEARRIELLMWLYVEEHPLSILHNLELSDAGVFMIDDSAASSIREGLANPVRRKNESVALATVAVMAKTPDTQQFVYQVRSFQFKNLGTADSVLSLLREQFNAGEIEVHSHLFSSPDYLGQTDIGDLIASLEGPAWVHPQANYRHTAQRIFGILSIHSNRFASLQFYLHDLRDILSIENNYGLKKLGQPISLLDAY